MCEASGDATASRSLMYGAWESSSVQAAPPLVVPRMAAFPQLPSPVAHAVVALTAATAVSMPVPAGALWSVQLVPFVVAMIRGPNEALPPTARPWLESTMATPVTSYASLGIVCVVHDVPEVVLTSIMPPALPCPTAHTLVVPRAKATDSRPVASLGT